MIILSNQPVRFDRLMCHVFSRHDSGIFNKINGLCNVSRTNFDNLQLIKLTDGFWGGSHEKTFRRMTAAYPTHAEGESKDLRPGRNERRHSPFHLLIWTEVSVDIGNFIQGACICRRLISIEPEALWVRLYDHCTCIRLKLFVPTSSVVALWE